MLFFVCLLFTNQIYGEEGAKKEPTLFDKAEKLWKEENPFKEKKQEAKGEGKETESVPSPAADPKEDSLSRGDFRLIPKIGLGTLGVRTASGHSPSGGAFIGILGDKRFTPSPWAFESGIGLIAISGKNSFETLSLSYWMFPFNAHYYFAPISKNSKLYLKSGLALLLLSSANSCIGSCSGGGGGGSHHGDKVSTSALSTDRSVNGAFKSSDLLFSLGVGADFLIFKSFLLDSFWITLETDYSRSLMNTANSNEYGGSSYNEGFMFTLGLALDF